MEELSPSDLKTILHSKRVNLYYLQHCRLLVNGGIVEYVTDEGSQSKYWNIPIANTTAIILGTGTSITQAVAREFAKAGVVYGFCGGGGTPLFSSNQCEIDIEWHLPQSEYRPTEYLQQWISLWQHEDLRLQAAINFQKVRLLQIQKHWLSSTMKREHKFRCCPITLEKTIARFNVQLDHCLTSQDILSLEANMTKALYKIAANTTDYGNFKREKKGSGIDRANRVLDHGNYLAYGLGASATWVLGLPHALSILHGKTRRGGLVFDIADIIKDALILPHAFIAAMAGEDEQEFRQRCLDQFQQAEALDVMIETIQKTAGQFSKVMV